jgi:hypothetical protein
MSDDIDSPITPEEQLEYESGFVKDLDSLIDSVWQTLDECDGYKFLSSEDNDTENLVKNLKYHCDHMVSIHHDLSEKIRSSNGLQDT